MTSISPVIPGQFEPEVIYARDQPEYLPLPAWRDPDGTVVTRWHATWRERIRIAITGDVWLQMLTFNQPLQPVMLHATCPVIVPSKAYDCGEPCGPPEF